MSEFDDVSNAARLIAFGFQPTQTPGRTDGEYRALVERHRTDPAFAQAVQAVARGFDLTVIAVDQRAGIVLGPTAETKFAASVADHIPRPADRPIAALAHLAIAALAFPRPETLDDDDHGRITVNHVDDLVTAAAQELDRRAQESGDDDGAPADQPDLVLLWRYYLRRNAVGTTRDPREHSGARRALIKRVAEYLAQNGMLRRAGDADGGTFTTTTRFQIQVRELASQRMLSDLAALGVAVYSDGSPTLITAPTTQDGQLDPSPAANA